MFISTSIAALPARPVLVPIIPVGPPRVTVDPPGTGEPRKVSTQALLPGSTAAAQVLEVGARSDDGGRLRSMTAIPRTLWFLFWLAATLAGAAFGA